MNRNQIFTTLEFIDDQIRVCLGEYFKEKFYVFDTLNSNSIGLKNNIIIDEEEVSKTIVSLLQRAFEKTETAINEVTLCLPSDQMSINNTPYTTPVKGKNSLISQSDIDNTIKVAFKVRHDNDQEIIDLVPIEFTLDNLEKLDFTPIGYKSSTLKILFNVLTLPKELIDSYKRILDNAKVKIHNYYLDVNCLYSGAILEDDLDVAILNLMRYSTSLNIYKRGKLYEKFYLNEGIDKLALLVESEFGVDHKTALELISLHGNAKENLTFNKSILKITIDNKETFLKQNALSALIENEMGIIFNKLIKQTNNILSSNSLNVIVTGFGSIIKNIDLKFHEYSKVETAVFRSSHFGISQPNNTQTLGLIKLNYKNLGQNNYKNLQTQNKDDIIKSSDNNEVTSTSKFRNFIIDEEEFE